MKILVLGHNGMLGHIVSLYLKSRLQNVIEIDSRWPYKSNEEINELCPDIIINCIAALPQKNSEFSINFELPKWLNNNTNAKVIHASSDREYGDDYGKSKSKATEYIINHAKNFKIIRTSIIGPEINNKHFLLEWFLASNDSVEGYTNVYWNGITSLKWAEICFDMIKDWQNYNKVTWAYSNSISKEVLLRNIKRVYKKDIIINSGICDNPHKCISGNFKVDDISQQLQELKSFYC